MYEESFTIVQSILKLAKGHAFKDITLFKDDSHALLSIDLWFRHEFSLICIKPDCNDDDHKSYQKESNEKKVTKGIWKKNSYYSENNN